MKRFEACGWNASRIDGHDPKAIAAALEKAQTSDKPVMIACKTKIGFGAPTKAGKSSSHGSPLGADEIKGAREALGWDHVPFEIPDDILSAWRTAGARAKPAHADWNKRLAALDAKQRSEFERRMQRRTVGCRRSMARCARARKSSPPSRRTSRRASLPSARWRALVPALPEMIGGSADLTGSNNTRTKSMQAMTAADFSGRFIHYGMREHGMAAAMNGMAVHGGIIPYSGTFLVFSDYARPAIRLAALMGVRVIHVHHPRLHRPRRGRTRRTSRSSISRRCAPSRTCWCSARPTRSRRWNAGSSRCRTRTGRACWR